MAVAMQIRPAEVMKPAIKDLGDPGIPDYDVDEAFLISGVDGDVNEDEVFGRIKVSTIDGNTDGDPEIEELHNFGGRSFSIYDENGNQVFDSGDLLARVANAAGVYDDNRSDDKGTEPEGVTIGKIGDQTYMFGGLERVDSVVVFNITDPTDVQYVGFIEVDDAPEGLTFISSKDSPNGRDLLVVTSEGDSTLRVLQLGAPEELFVQDGELVYLARDGEENDVKVSIKGQSLVLEDSSGNIESNIGVGDGTGRIVVPLADLPEGLRIDTGDENDSILFSTGFKSTDFGGLTIRGGDGEDEINYDRAILNLADGEDAIFDAETIKVGFISQLNVQGSGGIDFDGESISIGVRAKLTSDSGSIDLLSDRGENTDTGDGIFLYGGEIRSVSGDISLNGEGGGSGGDGVNINRAKVITGGTGTIDIDGVGGDGENGVNLTVATVTVADGGAIEINGTGGEGGTGVNVGIVSKLTGTGSATISIEGAGSNSVKIGARSTLMTEGGAIDIRSSDRGENTDTGEGVYLDSGSTIKSVSGTINLVGEGGGAGGDGVKINRAKVITGGTGTVLIQGVGGDGDDGVSVIAGTVTADNGTIQIVGTGGGNGGTGVSISTRSKVTGTGTAVIGIQGFGGSTGDNNVGVKIGGASTISVNDGALGIIANSGPGDNSHGIQIESSTISSSGSGAIGIQGTATGNSGIGLYVKPLDHPLYRHREHPAAWKWSGWRYQRELWNDVRLQ